jgi:NitT/TauT family transport system permease protein
VAAWRGPLGLRPARPRARNLRWVGEMIWYATIGAVTVLMVWQAALLVAENLGWADLETALGLGAITLLRVSLLIALATALWLPLGVLIGLRPKLAQAVQPIAQFLAAFPANLLFPVAVVAIVGFRLNADIWLSLLMILGAQWYILFNVIAGASTLPKDLRDVAMNLRITGWQWWRKLTLPGVFPYYITGAVTASGGCWNASIVAESVSWGSTHLQAHGLGAYIAAATTAGDFPRIVLGIAVMSVYVILFNRLLWRPLYVMAERRFRLD